MMLSVVGRLVFHNLHLKHVKTIQFANKEVERLIEFCYPLLKTGNLIINYEFDNLLLFFLFFYTIWENTNL